MWVWESVTVPPAATAQEARLVRGEVDGAPLLVRVFYGADEPARVLRWDPRAGSVEWLDGDDVPPGEETPLAWRGAGEEELGLGGLFLSRGERRLCFRPDPDAQLLSTSLSPSRCALPYYLPAVLVSPFTLALDLVTSPVWGGALIAVLVYVALGGSLVP